MKKARERTIKPLAVPSDPFEHNAQLAAALLSARDNFSAETVSSITLPDRVCALLNANSAGLLRSLVNPATRGRYHMAHIQTTPETVLKDEYNFFATYDTIIPRKHLHFDIYRSIQKLNAAENLIRKDNLVVTTSLQEAHLLILFAYLKQRPVSYETHFNTEAIVEGPDPEISNEKIWIDNGNSFYQRSGNPPTLPRWPTPLTPVTTSPEPTIVRLINEDYVIQAFKMLTENLTMFLVDDNGEDGLRGRIAIVEFEDRVDESGELGFDTKVSYIPEMKKTVEDKVAPSGMKAPRKTGSLKGDSVSVAESVEEDGRVKKRQRNK